MHLRQNWAKSRVHHEILHFRTDAQREKDRGCPRQQNIKRRSGHLFAIETCVHSRNALQTWLVFLQRLQHVHLSRRWDKCGLHLQDVLLTFQGNHVSSLDIEIF